MNAPKVSDLDYINFLVAAPHVVSCNEAARVQPEGVRRAAHEALTRLKANHQVNRDGLKELVLTDDWQAVPDGWTVPAGADIQMDLNGGTRVRLPLPQYDYEVTRARELFEADDFEKR